MWSTYQPVLVTAALGMSDGTPSIKKSIFGDHLAEVLHECKYNYLLQEQKKKNFVTKGWPQDQWLPLHVLKLAGLGFMGLC